MCGKAIWKVKWRLQQSSLCLTNLESERRRGPRLPALGVSHLDFQHDSVLSVSLCWTNAACLHLYSTLSLPSSQGHIKILLVAAAWISRGTADSPGGIRLQSGWQHLPFSPHDRPASALPLILALVISAASSLDPAAGIHFFKCQLS